MRLYYKIMVSSIYTARNNGFMSDIWKFASSIYFAFASSIYGTFFYLFLNKKIIPHRLDFLYLNIIGIGKYNFILTMILYFILPIMLSNYYFIFYKKRYIGLIKNNKKSYSKRLFAYYFIASIVLIFVVLFLFSKK